MKSISVLCLLVLPFAALAQVTTTDSMERRNELDRIGGDLREVRQEVDQASAGVSQVAQAQYQPVYDALDRAENVLAQLRTASEIDRGSLEMELEQAREDVRQAWSEVRNRAGIQSPETAR